jgi:DNA-binding NarL/FixJ family response regulator
VADHIPVFVYANDPVSEAGLVSQLRGRSELVLLTGGDMDRAAVALVAADTVDDQTIMTVRGIQRHGCPRVVLVLGILDETSLLSAVEAGACGMIRRCEASPERLVGAISSAARGDGTLPPDLLGRLLEQVGRMQRDAPTGARLFRTLNEREVEVLRLLAEGYDTAEVASTLSFSERTVKNVLYAVTSRLQLRNRTHAVAYAVREGFI